MESKKDAGRNEQKKIWLMSLNKEGGRKQISGTRMGLGMMKRKREKILLEKQTDLYNKTNLQSWCFKETTIQYFSIKSYYILQRENGKLYS